MKGSRRQNDLLIFQLALLPFVFFIISFMGKAYLQKKKKKVLCMWVKYRSADKICAETKQNLAQGDGCETLLQGTCKLSQAAVPK